MHHLLTLGSIPQTTRIVNTYFDIYSVILSFIHTREHTKSRLMAALFLFPELFLDQFGKLIDTIQVIVRQQQQDSLQGCTH